MILISIHLFEAIKLEATYKTVYTCSSKEEHVLQRNITAVSGFTFGRR